MSVDPLALVKRQQGGVLLDTNVLLLFVMMAIERSYVSEWKRTQQFSEAHMDALQLLVANARGFVTTPHILTEVTNLADKLPSHLRRRFMIAVARFAQTARERYKLSAKLSKDVAFGRLGLADVAQLVLPTSAKPVIITVDGPLFIELEQRRLPAVNLNHYAF
jgi:hypothetical protein